jgi:ATP-dependent RNA helicase DeaD
VGYDDEVKPGNIVGAIANEADIESEYIGHIEIYDDFSTVDLPDGMPRETFQDLKKVWVSGKRLNICRLDEWGSEKQEDSPKRGKLKIAKKAKKPKGKSTHRGQGAGKRKPGPPRKKN